MPTAVHAVANGEPLAVRAGRLSELEHYEEKVATVRDGEGHTVADIYERGTRINHIPVWYGYQGREYVDAEAFFRIAGDEDSRGRVRRSRKVAYALNRGGWIATAAGIGLIIAVAAMPEDARGRTGLFVGGLVGLAAGPSIAIWGAKRLSPERHGVSSLDAAMAAAQYNDQVRDAGAQGAVGKAVRVRMAWRF